jgi:hypothetical protein
MLPRDSGQYHGLGGNRPRSIAHPTDVPHDPDTLKITTLKIESMLDMDQHGSEDGSKAEAILALAGRG